MIQNIQYRRPAPAFSQPEWRSTPFRRYVKGPDQQLFDLGEAITWILAAAEKSKSTPREAAHAEERIGLLEQCLKLNEEYDAWYEQLKKDIQPPHYWPEFATMRNPVDKHGEGRVYPVAFRFPNIFLAKLMVDYWALSIILLSTTFHLYLSLKDPCPPDPGQPEHPAGDKDPQARAAPPIEREIPVPAVAKNPMMIRALADLIAQSMEYCLSSEMGILGSQWALFGLRAALQTYQYFPKSRQLRWLQETHDRISDQKGVKFSKAIAAKRWASKT